MNKLSLKEAATAARLSQWAYYPHNQFTRLVTGLFGELPEEVHFIEDKGTGTQCYVINHDSTSWVDFRGTETDKLKDFLTDADFAMDDVGLGVKIHRGIHKAWYSVRSQLRQTIRYPNNKISIGHSLGGGLSLLEPALRHYPFCPPRVGNCEFKKLLSRQPTWTFIRHQDIVPRVIPRWMGAFHIGNIVYFDSQNEMHINPSHGFMFRDFFFGDPGEYVNGEIDWLQDHSIEWIADRLEVLANG